MAPFRENIRRLASRFEACEEWLELVRDLGEPIEVPRPGRNCRMRWAEKGDLFTINALEGFVKETDFMEESLKRGDRCLVLEDEDNLIAFAWVTFRDFQLALWYTLKLPPGWSYLVYIFVHPLFGRQGLGAYLLSSLMQALRSDGYEKLIAGMYSTWQASFGLHTKVGFRVLRRLSQCKLMHILPTPPKVVFPLDSDGTAQ